MRRFGPYLGATAAALVYQYLLAPQPETHPIPPGSGDEPAPALERKAVVAEAKESSLEAVAVADGSAGNDLSAWK